MLPDSLLLHQRDGETVIPRFLDEPDVRWLEEVLVRRERAIGRPQLELESILAGATPLPKRRLVAKVLAGLTRAVRASTLDPVRTRAALFGAAAMSPGDRACAVAIAGERLRATPADIESSVFADLPGERKVAPLPSPVSPEELRRKVNAALAAGFLLRAVRVTVTTDADPLPLLRHARWNGLIAEVGDGAVVLSGPFTLFRHTGLYGRALAGVLPALQSLGSFRATVDFVLRGRPGRLVLDEAAPVFVDDAVPTPRTSPIARLVKDFERLAPGWSAIPDPAPIVSATGEPLDADLLVLPPEGGPGLRVELLRFWTAPYVRTRLALWAAAGVRAVLLLDEARNGAEEPPPEHLSVIVFRKRPDAKAMLEVAAG